MPRARAAEPRWSRLALVVNRMMANDTRQKGRLPLILRVLRAHRRLLLAAVLVVAVFFGLPAQWAADTRILIGWDVGVAAYLAIAYWTMAHADTERIRRRASQQDEGKIVMLVLTIAAAIASIGAIVAELGGSKDAKPTLVALGLAVLTIIVSWTFIHTIFALHYAHEYFGAGRDRSEGGLQFPGNQIPDYWDFVYFSFVIGMTFQVSDVTTTSRILRRVVVAHGIVAFVFNTALLALMVNIAASAI